MNHETAIESQAAERYMLAQMTEAERDDFEEHYFDCFVCARDVETLEVFLANGKAVARANKAKTNRVFARMVPWAAAAGLAACVGAQQFVTIPRLTQQVATLTTLTQDFTKVAALLDFTPAARSAAEVPTVPGHRPLSINVEITADERYGSYRAVLHSSDNAVIQMTIIPAAETAEPVPVVVRPLPAGSYKMVIEGVRKDGNRPDITETYPFVVSGS
jgi:hypothetical protein